MLKKFPQLARFKSAESLLFLTIFACSVYFSEIAYQTSNYTSRLFLTEALVDHGTFRLDAYEATLGVDGAVYQDHLYSDKPPGSSLLMLPQYLLLGKPLKGLFDTLEIQVAVQNQDYAVQDVLAGWLVQIFSLALYSAVGFVALYRILGLLDVGRPFLLSLLTYFGTLMFAYATFGTGEMFTVPPLLLGLYYLLKSRFSPEETSWNSDTPSPIKTVARFGKPVVSAVGPSRIELPIRFTKKDRNYLWAGFWYGLAFFVTNQVLLLIGVAALSLFLAMRKMQPLILFLLPPFIFALLTMGYNWLLFDHPLHFPQQYWRQGDPQVVLFGLPNLGKLAEMLFLPQKGLLFYSPYLVLALPGLYYLYRHLAGEKRYRESVGLLLGGSFLAYFIFYFFNLGWAGGADFGFRYIVVALPFLAVPAAVWLDKRPLNPLSWLLIIWSIALCSFGAITDPEVPTGVPNPLLHYHWPFFLNRATNNVPNLLLEQLFQVDNWLLRLSTTLLFLAVLAAILWRTRPDEE